MAQTLLLGLGGTGSRIVNYVASDLKKKGYSVDTTFESAKNRWGDTTSFARYSFKKAQ